MIAVYGDNFMSSCKFHLHAGKCLLLGGAALQDTVIERKLAIFSNLFDYSMDGHKKEWMRGGCFSRYMTY